jgi:hypothetical protein
MKRNASRAAVVLTALAWAASTAAAQPSGAGIEKIAAYAGTWHSRTVHYKTAYSTARVETASVRNDCWRSAGYYACDQFVNGPSAALIVYTYDAKRDLYHTSAIPPGGSTASSGELKIAGNTWTFPWTDRQKGKIVYARVVNVFRNADTIDFREEFSLDHAHWITTATGVEHRVATP